MNGILNVSSSEVPRSFSCFEAIQDAISKVINAVADLFRWIGSFFSFAQTEPLDPDRVIHFEGPKNEEVDGKSSSGSGDVFDFEEEPVGAPAAGLGASMVDVQYADVFPPSEVWRSNVEFDKRISLPVILEVIEALWVRVLNKETPSRREVNDAVINATNMVIPNGVGQFEQILGLFPTLQEEELQLGREAAEKFTKMHQLTLPLEGLDARIYSLQATLKELDGSLIAGVLSKQEKEGTKHFGLFVRYEGNGANGPKYKFFVINPYEENGLSISAFKSVEKVRGYIRSLSPSSAEDKYAIRALSQC
jgi:hypothetical protein